MNGLICSVWGVPETLIDLMAVPKIKMWKLTEPN